MNIVLKGLGTAALMGIVWLVMHNLLNYFAGKPLGVTSDLLIMCIAAFFGRIIGASLWGDKAA